jgi:hypothetical protein
LPPKPGVVPVFLLGIFRYALHGWDDEQGVPTDELTALEGVLLPPLMALLDVLENPQPKAVLDALDALAAAVVQALHPGEENPPTA